MNEKIDSNRNESQLPIGSIEEQSTSEEGDDPQVHASSTTSSREQENGNDVEKGFLNKTRSEGESEDNSISSNISRKDDSRSGDSFADDSTIDEDLYDRKEDNEESLAEIVTVPSNENEIETVNQKTIVYDLAGEKESAEEEKVEIEASQNPTLENTLIESGLVVQVTNQNVKESESVPSDSTNKSESNNDVERQKKRQRAKLGFILVAIIIIIFASSAAIVLTWKQKPRCEPTFNGRSSKRLGDGFCHPDLNNAVCNWDNGDCDATKHLYENCNYTANSWFPMPSIGDGHCHHQHLPDYPFNISECRFEGGDCIRVNCDESQEQEDRKEFCEEYLAKYPFCKVDNALKIGNGVCNFVGGYNTEECGFDGGDCADYPECRFDESELQADLLWPNYYHDLNSIFKDGHCHNILNKKECAFDGGDCIEFNKKFPGCQVGSEKYLGNGRCQNFGGYNTEECKWDNGDCVEFNSKYPNCNIEDAYTIGNGWCDGHPYNTEDCGFDGGDCLEFNEKYPNCNVTIPDYVGDGICDELYVGYNSIECMWDGGDCEV